MLTKTDVANLALGYLGVSLRVTDFDTDNSNQIKIIRRHFNVSLQGFLESHPWHFATSYSALALKSENPDSGYGYEYSAPADALTIRQIANKDSFIRDEIYEENKIRFEEILTGTGLSIHTDVSNAYAEYTRNLSPDSGFPPYFAKGLGAYLSKEIAPSLITNNFGKLERTLNSRADARISEAIAIDMGRQPRKLDPVSPFAAARMK